jgi:hypothetical protein
MTTLDLTEMNSLYIEATGLHVVTVRLVVVAVGLRVETNDLPIAIETNNPHTIETKNLPVAIETDDPHAVIEGRDRGSRSPPLHRDDRSRSLTNSKKRQPLRSQDQEFKLMITIEIDGMTEPPETITRKAVLVDREGPTTMSCPVRTLIRVVEHVRGTMSPLLGHLRCRRKSMPNPILVCLRH